MKFKTDENDFASDEVQTYDRINMAAPDDDEPVEGDWGDEDDEDFDDIAEAREDLRDISEGANLDEPTPEDDDHLPDDDLQ